MDYKWNDDDDDDEHGISNHVMDWQNETENNNEKKCFADFAINFHPFNVTRLKIDPKVSMFFLHCLSFFQK